MNRAFWTVVRYSIVEEGWHEVGTVVGMAAGLALYYFSPQLPIYALGSAVFIALAWNRLPQGILFILFSAPFYLFPKSIGSWSFSLTEFVTLACFGVWALQHLAELWARGFRLSATSRSLWSWANPVLLLFLAASLSIPFSEYLRFSLREYRTVIIEPLLFYLMLVTTLRSSKDIRPLVDGFVFLGAILSFIALYHYFFIGEVEATGGVQRMLAIYHSPNAMALFLGRVAPMAITLLLLGMPNKRNRVFYGGASLLILVTLLFTYSRGAWFGVAAALVFVALWRGQRSIMLLGGAGAALLGTAATLLGIERVFTQITTLQRVYVWQSALQMIRDRPLMGVGLDNFLYYYRERGYMVPDAWAEPDVSHAHNILLDFWTRLGLLGVLTLGWLQITFWRRGTRLYRELAGNDMQVFVLALMAGMVELLAHGLLDNSFFLIDLAVVFWFLYGSMEVLVRCSER